MNHDLFVAKAYLGVRGWFHCALVFGEDKITVAKLGQTSELDGAGVGAAYFGVLGAIFGKKSEMHNRQKRMEMSQKLKNLPLNEILEMDKGNFQVNYADIDKVLMEQEVSNFGIGKLRLEGKMALTCQRLGIQEQRKTEFHIEHGQDYKLCRNMVTKAFAEKLAPN